MSAVTIIDSGLSNIDSVARALEYCGADVVITRDPETVRTAGRLLLPGVGAFPVAMERLNALGLSDAIRDAVVRAERPILGICLGMQLLADTGHENETTLGLGLIKGDVRRLEKATPEERIPHMGWNTVEDQGGCPLLQDVPSGSDFYFVHSYYFAAVEEAVLATTPSYGGVPAIVGQGQVFGAQFHPEKSQTNGFQLLKNFLKA
ncbi:MAG: imidazole glycerol phosphate synthase subunit HisH [Alphaproteobacteria bacterium]|jgi:imidazole glycerol-phosphate synthase subunit HisH|nr:imidazole glycerol phosphate synthase subunit HisH [Alphaproteobacteria bacterium]